MKKAIIAVVTVGVTVGTILVLKNKKGYNVLEVPTASLATHLKNSDLVSPKTVKRVGKKVDRILKDASSKSSNPAVAEIIGKVSKLNLKQQKKLVKYVRRNFS